ncbi:acyltransferase family protein [Paraurantiacibacter namhicola]|uniref:Acyltransferase family protein n=1 Tax=Paraurantiacibacter namhicola TaxID=645517 RepID=A0A1C7DAV3_9SPHN|nr:acyltransferase [Paraurantiacibacter namhicola]ANU08616.1 Acyltransferase family protein [Paraurantiacibacter namhicola]
MTAATTRPAGSAPTPPGHPGKLRTVEMGRGIAALAVVAFHVNATASFNGLATSIWTGPLQFGVDFFFVLSGFIITYVHRADVGQTAKAWPYALKRFIRLYPLLWLVVGGWIVLRTLMGEMPSAAEAGTSLLLYPSTAMPVPNVVWTLRHEILFYLAFCVAIANRTAGLALFGAWTLAVLWQMAMIAGGNPVEGVGAMVLSSFVLDFVIGALVALLAARRRVDSWWPLVLGLVLVVAYSASWVVFGWSRTGTLDYTSWGNLLIPLGGLAFGLTLYGLLCVEDRVRVPQFAVLLGGASYAIYLVHVPVLAVLQRFIAPLGDGIAHVLLFAAASAAGVVVHLLFELPVTKALRNRLLPRRKPADA